MALPGVFYSDSGPIGSRKCDPLPDTMLQLGQHPHAPLYTLTGRMRSEEICHTMISWQESQEPYYTSHVTGNCDDPCGQTLFVSNPEMLDCRTLLYSACSGELLMVMAVHSDCSVTVKRGFACTTVCPINPGDELERVTTAFEEYSCPPRGFYMGPRHATNLSQIIRSACDASGTAMAQCYDFGDLRRWMKKQTVMRHMRDKELAMFFSRRATGLINGKPFRMMDGLDAQLCQNRFVSPPCGLDRLLLDAFLERIFSVRVEGMPNERIFFGSSNVLTAINEIGWKCTQKFINFDKPNKGMGGQIGINFSEYVSPHGTIKMMIHPHMQGKAWGGRLYAIHPGMLHMYHMRNRQNIEQDEGLSQSDNGSSRGLCDGAMCVMTSEFSMAYKQQATGGVMECIKPAYAADC